jgi:putative transcriptional regulator
MFRERQRYFYQAVILLLDHGPEGSYGIILNRPTQYKVSQIKSTVHELLALFKDNRLYMGGDCGDTAMVVLTQRSDIQGVTEVTQGIYHHNVHGAGAAVAAGLAEPEDFRFFAQYAGWAPGQLEEECKSGVWFCTAASPSLTLDQELSNGGAMWHAILQVMGGDHARVSDIVSEVEQRDLREATARLQQAAAGGSRMLPTDSQDGDAEDCTSCYADDSYESYPDSPAGQWPSRSSRYEDS